MRAPRRIALARLPTPLQPLDRLSEELGGPRIWVKRDDLTESGAGGNKVRKLEFVIAEAIHQGADTLITCGGLQSNHCRATALLGARLGLRVDLVLRGEPSGTPDGNLFLDQLAGAAVHCYPARRYQCELDILLESHAEDARRRGQRPFVIPTGASDGLGVWGYLSASEELAADFRAHGIRPRHVLVATGSGGTQAGLTAGLHLHAPWCSVHGVAVCDDAGWFRKKVTSDLRDWRVRARSTLDLDALRVDTLDAYIGPGYGVADEATRETIRRVARTEGLLLDPVYTGKAFHGMLKELSAGRLCDGDDIVFIHTGGLFGLFPQRADVLGGAEQPG